MVELPDTRPCFRFETTETVKSYKLPWSICLTTLYKTFQVKENEHIKPIVDTCVLKRTER